MNIYETLAKLVGEQKSLHISYPDAGNIYIFKDEVGKPYFKVHVGIVGKTEDGKKVVQAIFKANVHEEIVALKRDCGLRDESVTFLSVEDRLVSIKTEVGSYVTKSARKLSKEVSEDAIKAVLSVILSEENGQGNIVNKLAEALEKLEFESRDILYEVREDKFNKFKLSSLIVQQKEGGDAIFFYTDTVLSFMGLGTLEGVLPVEAVRELDEFIGSVEKAEDKDEEVSKFLKDFLKTWLLANSKKFTNIREGVALASD